MLISDMSPGLVTSFSCRRGKRMLDSQLGTLETAIRKTAYREFGQPENV